MNILAILELIYANRAGIAALFSMFGSFEKLLPQTQHLATVLTYTRQTADKVKAFQQAHGLEIDGIVGDQTWSKVEELLSVRTKSGVTPMSRVL